MENENTQMNENSQTNEGEVVITKEQLDVLTNRLTQLEKDNEIKDKKHEIEMETLRESLSGSKSDNVNDDDVPDSLEKHAQFKKLKIHVDNKGVERPIIWTGGVSTDVQYDKYRRPIVSRQYIEVLLHGEGKTRKLNYSSDKNDPDNYVHLKTKQYELVNQSVHDYNKTGASNVHPDQIVSDSGKIEVKIRDESTGEAKGTGKYVRGVARTHKYEYTVLIDGEEVQLDVNPHK